MKKSRREFMQKSMAGLAAVPAIINDDKKKHELENQLSQAKKIIYRILGKTGIKVPVVGMGMVDNIYLLPYASDLGLRFILSSGDYRKGNSERQIGEYLKTVPRDKFIVSSGFDPRPYINSITRKFKKSAKNDSMIKFAEDSLKRLKLDYLDIYHIGNMENEHVLKFEPIIRGFEELKKSGKIRFAGAATHQHEPLVLKTAADSGVYDVVMTSCNFRKSNREDITKAIAYASGKGLGIIAMKTQAGVYWDRSRKKMINMKAALKWALGDRNVHTSVPAFSNIDELNEGFSVMEDLSLTDSELKDLRISDDRSKTGMFCQQCGKCLTQCNNRFDIPSVMRCYMYVYGYRNPVKAKETLVSVNLRDNPCRDCGNCVVECQMGFDIKTKVSDIFRLNEIPDEFLV